IARVEPNELQLDVKERQKIIQITKEAGQGVNEQNALGETALIIAIRNENLELAIFITENLNPNLKLRDNNQHSAYDHFQMLVAEDNKSPLLHELGAALLKKMYPEAGLRGGSAATEREQFHGPLIASKQGQNATTGFKLPDVLQAVADLFGPSKPSGPKK
ncbi:MAG: hypothetical protein ABSF18_01445, partial [Gammaproteobacteria bacterium]